jgi:hypothetical protein
MGVPLAASPTGPAGINFRTTLATTSLGLSRTDARSSRSAMLSSVVESTAASHLSVSGD